MIEKLLKNFFLSKVRVRSATTSNWVCAHVCVRTLIWTCEVRACDPKNGRNSHLELTIRQMGSILISNKTGTAQSISLIGKISIHKC